MKVFNLNLVSKYRSELMGFSILWIWFLHMSCKFPFPISTIQSIGATGVDIFFFVSAIGLYFSYSRNEDTLQFYKRRFFRIIPTYLIIAIPYRIYDILAAGEIEGIGEFFKLFIKKLLLVNFWTESDASLWYIPSILVCYLAYPIFYNIFDLKRKKTVKIFCFIILSVLSVGSIIFLTVKDFPHPTDRWFFRMPIFLFGCLIAPYVKKGCKIKNNNIIWILFFIIVFGIFTFLNIKTGYLYFGNIIWVSLFNSLFALPLLVLIPCFFEKFKIPKLSGFLKFFGKYTLELYILNEAALGFARNQTDNAILIDIISAALTAAALLIIILIKNKTDISARPKSTE